MRVLLYCLLSYAFTLCHVAQAEIVGSNIAIDLLRYDLLIEQPSGQPIQRKATVIGSAIKGPEPKEVFIPNRVSWRGDSYTVTIVSDYAFTARNLISVRLPTTLETIGIAAFTLNRIDTVTIPDSVTSIGEGAFEDNGISLLTLGAGLLDIGKAAFSENSLSALTIPNRVVRIGEEAFEYNRISSLTLGTSLSAIGSLAFIDNAILSVTIPDSVTKIGSEAFAVNEITSVTFEGDYRAGFSVKAFENNQSLTLIEACDKASGWKDKFFRGHEFGPEVFTSIAVTLTPDACEIPPSLPIWLLWVGAGACSPPGKVINNDNFSDAVTDWLDKGNTSQYGDITQWCTQDVTDMSNAFNGLESTAKANFNADISGWNTSRVTNMNNMFRSAAAFNQDISKWDTSRVTTMRFMFERAAAFNRNIGGWKTGAVTDMNSMFSVAGNFNQNIGGWDTSKVTDMSNMFMDAVNFNQDISRWDVSAVTTMFNMFVDAEKFNRNLSSWNVAGDLDCFNFADGATDWKAEYDGSISGKTPPLSPSMIVAGCNSD